MDNKQNFFQAAFQNGSPEQAQPGNELPKTKKSPKGIVIASLAVIVLALGAFLTFQIFSKDKKGGDEPNASTPNPSEVGEVGSFYAEFLKQAYGQTSGMNMMVSPYSMEAVWRLAEAGAAGNTKAEITRVFGERTVPSFAQLKSANGMFIRESFAPYVREGYTSSFAGDLRYDSFESADSINSWVSEKTDGMIGQLLEQAPNEDLVVLLLNAIVMDEQWRDPFECEYIDGEEFDYSDGRTDKVTMMSGDADKYFETENATGVVRDYATYEDGSAFEFVGILPNGSVSDYLNIFGDDEIAAMDSAMIKDGSRNSDGGINYVSTKLPRFKYDYTVNDAIGIMKNMGIKDALDVEKADFSTMIKTEEKPGKNFYVGQVIHKTRIELGENGTKAAAVSSIGILEGTTAYDEPTNDIYYHVDFNRPFVYLIRDKATKEIIFEGVVEQPEKWTEETNACPEE